MAQVDCGQGHDRSEDAGRRHRAREPVRHVGARSLWAVRRVRDYEDTQRTAALDECLAAHELWRSTIE